MFHKHIQINLLYPFLHLPTLPLCSLLGWQQLSYSTAKEPENWLCLLPRETGLLSANALCISPARLRLWSHLQSPSIFPNELHNCLSPNQPPHGSQALLNPYTSRTQETAYAVVFQYGFPFFLVSSEIMSNWSQLNYGKQS